MKHTLRDVSIVIVTYKGDDLIRDCLASLSRTCGTQPQIVVVDNSPAETTRNIVAGYPNAIYVSSPGNPGFAGGNNRALKYCDREYILLLNNDTKVHTSDSICQLIDFLDDNPKCAVVQGSGRLSRAGNTIAGCGSFLMRTGFMWSPGFNCHVSSYDRNHSCFSVSGFFMMLRRSIIPNVGGFLFRSHFWCYYEETDFCHRVWLSGNEVWYVQTPSIDHVCSATSSQFSHEDIMSRHLRNLLFSLSANLSWWNRLRILSVCKMMLACHSFVHLIKGNYKVFKSDWAAISMSKYDKKRLAVAKRQISRIRKVSDGQIFRHILTMPPFKEFLKYLLSNA